MTSAHDHLLVSRLPGRAGQTLLDSIRASSHQLRAPCAGRGSCGKCRVIVHSGNESVGLTPLADAERELLSDTEIAHGVIRSELARLAIAITYRDQPDALDANALTLLRAHCPDALVLP